MLLGNKAIQEEREKGNIIISPYSSYQMNTESYDVRLGRWLYLQDRSGGKYWIDLKEYKEYKAVPGDFILAHTNEFIGTVAGSSIHPQFYLKSTSARLGILHPIAGYGDEGFYNRWALEFTFAIPVILKYKMKIGQVAFSQIVGGGDDYTQKGHYQSTQNLDEIKLNWKKESILPHSDSLL